VVGNWVKTAESTAAGGYRIWNPNANLPKVTTPAAAPTSYFDLTFDAYAGVPYHLWVRGEAQDNSYYNDSVWVQYSGAADASGNAVNRIGTTGGAAVILEDGLNAGVSGWGWADDAYGTLAGPVYFGTSGPQTIRVQVRADGMSIDQIVCSPGKYLTTAPGATKNDTTILPLTGGQTSVDRTNRRVAADLSCADGLVSWPLGRGLSDCCLRRPVRLK
jgi:hypothetical protein